ncbi:TIGR04283 family arsenosugar biosynthesis glycosyltransferase [Oceanibaculum indicum]|uniref:RSAM/selenodomain-associated transferase 2 n=1 Tax=Oceanibaculum indicum TaxID=526216 RepID=A0A420WCG0_9PROT|nr:TIGR04283 family arsenosugar biosynthesis glycosyltransferase [Oceanibaculum indicum]RKQ68592.1 rSAM/selenodomain-associated transferase 2 [Oceanibaculum indicum]
MTEKPILSIVIPTLNAAKTLPSCLAALRLAERAGPPHEIIIVDGGSGDATAALARQAGAQQVDAERGRGTQLRAGGQAANGDWLLFLHADTILSGDWPGAIAGFIADPVNRQRAAYCRLGFDDDRPAHRLIAATATLRSRLFGLPYGDQGLLIHRDYYRKNGAYPALPLMEDVALVRRIGRRSLILLSGVTAITSAERYRRNGAIWRVVRNWICLGAYFLGVSPERIAGFYR